MPRPLSGIGPTKCPQLRGRPRTIHRRYRTKRSHQGSDRRCDSKPAWRPRGHGSRIGPVWLAHGAVSAATARRPRQGEPRRRWRATTLV